MESFSQLMEDVWIHQNKINIPRKDIILVEIGAFDGASYSNSLMLEKALGCKPAVLVEPSPERVFHIRSRRPNSQIFQIAISSEFGTATFAGNTSVSGIVDMMTESYIDKWKIDTYAQYNVLTIPMWSLQKVLNENYIDFLSIDVQGAEINVLKSTDFSQPIGNIAIELEGHQPESDEECRNILQSNGFKFCAKLLISEIWTNPSYPRANSLYDIEKKIDFSTYEIPGYAQKHFANLSSAFPESNI